MLPTDKKRQFANVKWRVEERKKKMPSVKTDAEAAIENQNARELSPYVYKIIREAN